MNRSTVIIIGAFLCSAIIIAVTYYVVIYRGSEELGTAESQGIVAPEFSLPDAHGEMVSLGEIKADITIINFWASWSPYSSDELKAFNSIQSEYGKEVSVVALNRDTYPDDGKTFLAQNEIENTITFVYDRDDAYYSKVQGFAVPETLFLNDKGEIVFHKHGPLTYEEIRNQIEKMKK